MSCLTYIKQRYSGYIGVPRQYVNDELQCSPDELVTFNKYVKDNNEKPRPEFIPFEIFADGLDCILK